jgi:hypothetical protein
MMTMTHRFCVSRQLFVVRRLNQYVGGLACPTLDAAEDSTRAITEAWERGLLRLGIADVALLDWHADALELPGIRALARRGGSSRAVLAAQRLAALLARAKRAALHLDFAG